MAVAFAPGTDKLNLPKGVALTIVERGRSEVLENSDLDIRVDRMGGGFGQLDAVADADDVNVGAGTVEEMVADHPANSIGRETQFVGCCSYDSVDGVVEYEVHLGICRRLHEGFPAVVICFSVGRIWSSLWC